MVHDTVIASMLTLYLAFCTGSHVYMHVYYTRFVKNLCKGISATMLSTFIMVKLNLILMVLPE